MDGKLLDQILRTHQYVTIEGVLGPINEYDVIYFDDIQKLTGQESEQYVKRLTYDECIESPVQVNGRIAYIVTPLGLHRGLAQYYEIADESRKDRIAIRRASICSAIAAIISALSALLSLLGTFRH